ncbi:MAG: PhzF family phenazine biosynthesis protein [Pseudomonadota bacterium]
MLPFHIYDVFTDTAFQGNPLAIVENARALSTEQMAALAREFNLSETVFILPPEDPANTARVRIFTPDHEMPFAGHPTLGCAIYLASKGAGTAHIVLEENAGLVPVTITRDGDHVQGEFNAPVIPTARAIDLPRAALAAALGIAEDAIGPDQAHVVSGGPSFVQIGLIDAAALTHAQPAEPAFSALAEAAGATSVYVYAPGVETDYEARMFAPLSGIAEDPATGSATALFAAQLLANGALSDGRTDLALAQGRDMGRLSHLSLSIDVAAGAITAVRVGGCAVPVATGQIAPPR